MQKKILYYIHKLLGLACLLMGTYNVYSLSNSYLLAGITWLGMSLLWTYIFEKYCPESKDLLEQFILGKLSSEELLAKYKLLLEPYLHIKTCIYATFYVLTEVLSKYSL
jgi:hypothetical protein